MSRITYPLEYPEYADPKKRPPLPEIPDKPDVMDWKPGRWVFRPRQYYSRPPHPKAKRDMGERGLFYWEDPLRVVRYQQTINAQPPGTPSQPWMDHDVLSRAYDALRDYNKNEMWWNWRPLPFDDPMSRELRRMQTPPMNLLTSMGEEKYHQPAEGYQPAEEAELPTPATAGMTEEDWDKLPRWQRFLMASLQSPIFAGGMGAVAGLPLGAMFAGPPGAVIGAAAGASASIYAQQHPEGTMASMLMYLDLPAEWMEQFMGTVYQAATAEKLPEWSEVLKWLGAARKAGTLFYTAGGTGYEHPLMEATGAALRGFQQGAGLLALQPPVNLDILNLMAQADITLEPGIEWMIDKGWISEKWSTPAGLERLAEPGEVWKFGEPFPVKIEGDLAAVLIDARTRILAGEQPEKVIQEYTELYGATAQLRELVGHIVIDPLNVTPVMTSKLGAVAAKGLGNIELAHAFRTTHGLLEAAQQYGTTLRATKPVSQLSEAGAITRWLTGVSKTGDVKILSPATDKGGIFRYLLRMKPSNRASEVLNASAVNLAMILDSIRDPTADDLIRIIKALADTPDDVARELSMRSIQAPDGAAIPMFMKDFGDTGDELLLKWKSTAWQRRLLENLAEVTGKTDSEVLQMISNASDADILLRQFVDAAREKGIAENLVKAYDDARSKTPQLPPEEQLTGAKMQELVKVFIDDEIPHNMQVFKAQLYAATMDIATDWAAKWFGVKPDPTWIRLSQTIKSAQSLMLLGLNPTYFVNNLLNNTLTSAATGVFGLRSMDEISKVWARVGVEPPRLRAGVGPAALGTELEFAAIRSAMQAPGMLTDLTRFFNTKTRKIQIFSNLSMKAEQLASQQAYTTGFLQFMGRHWQEGVGFSRMPAPLERALGQIHPDLPRLVYGAIKGGMNQAEIEKALWSGMTRRSLDGAIPSLVDDLRTRGIGLSEPDIRELLSHSGVDELLRQKLAEAKTDEQVRAAFNEANDIVQDRLDMAVAQDLERTAAEVAGRVSGGEGLPAVLELFDEQQIEFTERWFENFAEWEEAFRLTENMDYNQRTVVMQAAAARQRKKWDRYYTSERSKIQGMIKGLGMEGEGNRRTIDLVDQAQRNHNEFYILRDKKNSEFFSNKFENSIERKVAWDTLQEELLEAYNDMTSKELYIQDQLDEMLVSYLDGTFGTGAREAGTQWRTGVGKIRQNMIDEMRAMRDALRRMPVDERRTAWLTFLHGRDGYLQQIAQYFRENVDGAHGLYNNLRGRGGEVEPLPGGAAPAPVAPPAPGGAPSQASMFGLGAPAPAAAPAVAPSVGLEAGIPFFIPQAMKARLRQLGYSVDEIADMTPDRAWEIVSTEAPVAAAAVAPEAPPTPEVPKAPVEPTKSLSPIGRRVTISVNGEVKHGVVDMAPKLTQYRLGGAEKLYIRVKLDDAIGSEWYPLESVQGLPDTSAPVEIPTVQPVTTRAQFAENARIAAEAGIPLLDAEGNRISGAEIHLMNAIKKYGGEEAKAYNRFEEVPTELVQRALDERTRLKTAEDEKWVVGFEEGLVAERPEVHPIDQAIMEGRLGDLSEDVRLAVEEAYGEMAADVDIAEQGFRIFAEAEKGGAPDVTGYKSTYPDWWSELGSIYYKDASGKKYTGKAAVQQVIRDIAEGKVNPKNKAGDDYALVSKVRGQVFDYLPRKKAYQIATGQVDVTNHFRRVMELRQKIRSGWIWDNPGKLQGYLDELNDAVIAELVDYGYEDIRITVDEALELQATMMNRLDELKRIPPEELTQMIEDANRLARIEISDYESRNRVRDYQMRQGVEPSDLFQDPKQRGMWEAGEDTPLFTGAAQKAKDVAYSPTETPTQGRMPGFEPQLKGAKAGGEAKGPMFDAAVKAGIFRREIRQKFIDHILSTQKDVLSGAWDAQVQADAVMALMDARANIWAKDTGRQPWEWYEAKIADVSPQPVDARNDPYLLGQIEANKGTPGYKAFADGNKCVDTDGDLITVYHGTTHEFRVFDPSKGEIESWLGQAIYATDSIDDVNANYAGYGPDLTQRIETLAERIADEIDLKPEAYSSETAQFFGMTIDGFWEKLESGELEILITGDKEGLSNFIARKRLGGESKGLVMPLHMRMENPAVLKPNGGTYLDLMEVYLADVDWIAEDLKWAPEHHLDEIRKYYGYTEDWDPDDLAAFIEDDRYDIANEIAIDIDDTDYGNLEQALRHTLYEMEIDTSVTSESIMAKVMEDHMEGDPLDSIIDTIKNRTDLAYATEVEEGKLAANDFIGRMLKNMGYDGVILDAGASFPRMEGTYGAKHYIVWEPTQVKSVFNLGEFDMTNPDIYYQRSFRPSPAWAGDEGAGVSVAFRNATEWSASRFDETVVPILESEGGAYAVAEDPTGGYVLDSVFSGQTHHATLHEARRAAWEEAFTLARKEPENLMYQAEIRPEAQGYFSGLRKLIAEEMPGQMAIDQLRTLIDEGGISTSEMEWSGIRGWLDEQADFVTKDDILLFLDEDKPDLEGLPLYNQKKGAVQFLKDGRAVIHALQSPDVSTLVHEVGHIFRMDLRSSIGQAVDDVTRARLTTDFETASKWAGVVQDADGEFLWSGEAAYRHGIDSDQYRAAVQAEEKFARGFEEYLMMGDAPAPALVPVFEKFKEWLAHIYARMRGQLAGVTPRMKEVYDRLLVEYPEAADYPITTEMGRAKVPSQGAMFQPSPPVNTENFRRWFGNSQVVNPDGSPMAVYHGTRAEFEAFDPNRSSDFGIHFGTPEQAARRVGVDVVPEGAYYGANVHEVYLSIEKPLRVDDFQWRGRGLESLLEDHADPLAKIRISTIQEDISRLQDAQRLVNNYHANRSLEGLTKIEFWTKRAGLELDSVLNTNKGWAEFNLYVRNMLYPEGSLEGSLWKKLNDAVIEEFERMDYDGMVYENRIEGTGDSWIAFHPEQIKSVRNTGEWNPLDPHMLHQGAPLEYENGYKTNLLFQDDTPEMNMPLGEMQSHNPSPPLGAMQDEAFRNHIKPIMTGLEDVLTGESGKVPERIGNLDAQLDPATMRLLKAYMGQVYGELGDTKLAGMRWAENRRDAALLNYSRRYGFDNFLTAVFPYQFWYTRSAMQWAMRFIDKPAWLAHYARIRNFQRTTIQTPGFPRRLQNKFKIPVPYLPEWAGGGIYIDPLRQIFPFEQFARPWEQRAQDQNMIEQRAVSLIGRWGEEGEANPQEAQNALELREGALWDKAITQAKLDVESETNNPWEFINLIMSPSLPIGWGYEWMQGRKDRISQLPATRLIQNVSGALGANQGRGWNIEGPLRRALGMAEYDRFHDYRVDREVSNLVGEGLITPEEGTLALTDKSGDAYLMAEQRAAKSQQIKYLGAPLGADLFPEGEQWQRTLAGEYDRARDAWLAGETDALTKFFDKYPEYEARKLSFVDDPEERLRMFLRSSIWDAYYELPDLHRKQLREQLGDVFTQAFLNKETRSYDSIDTPTLAQWAKVMKGVVPETAPETPEAQVELADKEVTEAYQAYVDKRDQLFPGIGDILAGMYEAPEESWDEYKQRFPQVDDYFVWRNEQFARHPEIITHAISEQSKMYGAPPEIQTLYYQFQTQREYQFPNIFEIQEEYFLIDPNNKSLKKKFREQHPELPAYWEWRREFMRQYPNMIPFLMSEESLAEAVLGEEQGYSPGGSTTQGDYVNIDINRLDPALVKMLTAYYMLGEPLGDGARKALKKFWNDSGNPGDSFKEFLDEILKGYF